MSRWKNIVGPLTSAVVRIAKSSADSVARLAKPAVIASGKNLADVGATVTKKMSKSIDDVKISNIVKNADNADNIGKNVADNADNIGKNVADNADNIAKNAAKKSDSLGVKVAKTALGATVAVGIVTTAVLKAKIDAQIFKIILFQQYKTVADKSFNDLPVEHKDSLTTIKVIEEPGKIPMFPTGSKIYFELYDNNQKKVDSFDDYVKVMVDQYFSFHKTNIQGMELTVTEKENYKQTVLATLKNETYVIAKVDNLGSPIVTMGLEQNEISISDILNFLVNENYTNNAPSNYGTASSNPHKGYYITLRINSSIGDVIGFQVETIGDAFSSFSDMLAWLQNNLYTIGIIIASIIGIIIVIFILSKAAPLLYSSMKKGYKKNKHDDND